MIETIRRKLEQTFPGAGFVRKKLKKDALTALANLRAQRLVGLEASKRSEKYLSRAQQIENKLIKSHGLTGEEVKLLERESQENSQKSPWKERKSVARVKDKVGKLLFENSVVPLVELMSMYRVRSQNHAAEASSSNFNEREILNAWRKRRGKAPKPPL